MLCGYFEVKPISVNAWYRNWNGRTVVSEQGRRFRKEMAECKEIWKELRLAAYEPTHLDGEVEIDIVFNFHTKTKRDCDNFVKAFLDNIKDDLIEDDSLVMRITAEKRCDKALPVGIRFHIRPFNSEYLKPQKRSIRKSKKTKLPKEPVDGNPNEDSWIRELEDAIFYEKPLSESATNILNSLTIT